MAKIWDGVYSRVETVVGTLIASAPSPERVRALQAALEQYRQQGTADVEEVADAIENEAPELAKLRDILPTTREELHKTLDLLLKVIALLLVFYKVTVHAPTFSGPRRMDGWIRS